MNERETTEVLRHWLESEGYSVFTGSQFTVRNTNGRRPDMVVMPGSLRHNSAIEIKGSRGRDIHKSYKIVSYAFDSYDSADYIIDGERIDITNFLVATDLSRDGKLFADDVEYGEKRRRKQAAAYDGWGRGGIEPYFEYVQSGEFVRGVWREWKEREGMEFLKVGILLSTRNDKEDALQKLETPKMFVMRFNFQSRKWGQEWTKL